jgi:hypothetical protein
MQFCVNNIEILTLYNDFPYSYFENGIFRLIQLSFCLILLFPRNHLTCQAKHHSNCNSIDRLTWVKLWPKFQQVASTWINANQILATLTWGCNLHSSTTDNVHNGTVLYVGGPSKRANDIGMAHLAPSMSVTDWMLVIWYMCTSKVSGWLKQWRQGMSVHPTVSTGWCRLGVWRCTVWFAEGRNGWQQVATAAGQYQNLV